MKPLYLIAFSFLCSTFTANAQQGDIIDIAGTFRYWEIKLPVMNLVDLNSPNFQVGIERRFNKQNGVQLQGGFSFDKNCCSEVNGTRLRAEYRRYLLKSDDWSYFIGTELFYTGYNMAIDGSFIDAATHTTYTDLYTLRKNMYGLNVKFGTYQFITKRFIFEAYAGLGLKYRIAKESGRSNPADEHEKPRHPNFYYVSVRPGEDVVLSVPLNFAIGYMIR